jgi:hypothetical protein
MSTFEFEIVDERRGWIRVEASTIKEAYDDIRENGFDATGCIGYEDKREVQLESVKQVD